MDLSAPISNLDTSGMDSQRTPLASIVSEASVDNLLSTAGSQQHNQQSCNTTTNTHTVVVSLSPSSSPIKIVHPTESSADSVNGIAALENKLHIPRPFYSRDPQSRTATGACAAVVAGARIRRGGPAGQARSGLLSLNNPVLLAKYAVPNRLASSVVTLGSSSVSGLQRVPGAANQVSRVILYLFNDLTTLEDESVS